MKRLLTHALLILVLLATLQTEATNRYYRDREAKSSDGRFVVTATSPDNESIRRQKQPSGNGHSKRFGGSNES